MKIIFVNHLFAKELIDLNLSVMLLKDFEGISENCCVNYNHRNSDCRKSKD